MSAEQEQNRGIASIVQKAEKSVENGNFYEAQQMYKTLYFRYLNKKRYADVRELLVSGATTMLRHNQLNEGIELAQLLLNLYKDTKVKVTKESLDPILNIIILHLSKTEDGNDVNDGFIKNVAKWTMENGEFKEGDPTFHNTLAEYYYSKGPEYFGKAQKHFLRGNEIVKFANMLVTWSQLVPSSEKDLIIARAVLQYIALSNLKDANIVMDSFMKALPELPQTPLINFLRFLLVAMERDAYPLFDILRKKYKPSLDRDPSFQQYLDHIALTYFKVQPTGGMNNFLGEMMKSLFSPQ